MRLAGLCLTAEQLELATTGEHERVLVDIARLREPVDVGADPVDRDGPGLVDRSGARHLVHPDAELARDGGEQRRPVRLREREPRNLDELAPAANGDDGCRLAHRPRRGRREPEAGAGDDADRLGAGSATAGEGDTCKDAGRDEERLFCPARAGYQMRGNEAKGMGENDQGEGQGL